MVKKLALLNVHVLSWNPARGRGWGTHWPAGAKIANQLILPPSPGDCAYTPHGGGSREFTACSSKQHLIDRLRRCTWKRPQIYFWLCQPRYESWEKSANAPTVLSFFHHQTLLAPLIYYSIQDRTKEQYNYEILSIPSFLTFARIDPKTGRLDLLASVNILADSPIPEEVWGHPYQVNISLLD